MPMTQLSGLLACSLLVLAAHLASANTTRQRALQNPIVNDTCPIIVKVGRKFDEARVLLEETNEFLLKPNKPEMSVKFQGADVLYKASVEGTMVKLFGCDEWEKNCELLDEGGTKNRDLLTVDHWNHVNIHYINGQISVDINMQTNVMGKHMMPMAKGSKDGGVGSIGNVTFVVPPASPFYDALLKINCDEYGNQPYIDTVPPAPTTAPTFTPTPRSASPHDNAPFPECPMYRLETDHPTPPIQVPVSESFTFAVYPSHAALHMEVTVGQSFFKLWVDGAKATMKKCNLMKNDCSLEGETSSVHNILDTSSWNEVTVYLDDGTLLIKVNNSELLSSNVGKGHYGTFQVVVRAPQDITFRQSEYFMAYVNVQCVGEEQHTKHPDTTQTPSYSFPTKDTIVETTTPAGQTSVSRDIWIVVGVLVGVLLIIAIAIIITTYRKRRVAPINEQSPLQTKQQIQ